MNDVICKIISSLNSPKIRGYLESVGYTYKMAPLNNYNKILRHPNTLKYNIHLFNASSQQIQSIALYLIKNIFNHQYISKLIKNNICMLSYIYNCQTNNNIEDYREILNSFLGRAKYSYVVENDHLKLIIDAPKNTIVSSWKEVLRKKESNIVLEFLKNNIEIKKIDIIFSIENKELDNLANTFLEVGYFWTNPKDKIQLKKATNDISKLTTSNKHKHIKHDKTIDKSKLYNDDINLLISIFNKYKERYCDSTVYVIKNNDNRYIFDKEKMLESKNKKIESFKIIEQSFKEELNNLDDNHNKLKELIHKYESALEILMTPPF